MNSNKPRVLIVDDEASILTALEFLLTTAGYIVETASSGEQALEKLSAFKPNTVLLDVMMPGIDGYEVARKIRSNPALNSITILFLTAKGEPADKLQGYATGGEFYITKPFDNQELLDFVEDSVTFSVK